MINASGHAVGPSDEGPSTIPVSRPTPTPFTRHDNTTPASPDSADSDEVTPKPGSERSDEWDLLPAPKIEKGQVLFGKYLLEEKLGEGGMGQVWRVENVMLQRESALKLIRPEIAQNDKGWKRFEREARLMAKITHPTRSASTISGEATRWATSRWSSYRASACTTSSRQRNGEPLPLDWISQFLDQLCSVLQEAHGHVDKKSGKAKPIIHRDLKPSNLMLVEGKPADQNLKVLDFGIAKIAEDDGNPELTGQGDFLGTPAYMSPEQIRGGITKEGRGGIDGRSDLYSVGVLLYQLLTGSLPFKGMNKMGVLAAHLHSTIPAMKDANPAVQVPPQVERLVMKCLEKDPDHRPQSARELPRLFREAIEGHEEPESKSARWKTRRMVDHGGLRAAGWLDLRHASGAQAALDPDAADAHPRLIPRTRTSTVTPVKKRTYLRKRPSLREMTANLRGYKVWTSQGYEPLTADRLQTFAAEKEAALDKLATRPGRWHPRA